MKTLLLLLLAAALSSAANTKATEPVKAFIPNREYRYDYESQILTGIPTLNSQYSGIKIKARAIIHAESDRYITIKLASIEVFRVKEVAGVVPTTWVSPAVLTPIPVEHSTAMIEALVIPIKFRYENGLVTKVYALTADPYWSVNIKRGIISLMNLDLNIQNPAPITSDVMRPFLDVISSDYNTMSAKTSYKVIEPSVLGDCETWYSVMPVPARSKLMVNKVVDTKRCSPKVMAEWGIFAGMPSGRNVSEMDQLIQNSVSVDYELLGTRHEFMINSAVLTGKYVFAPVAENIYTMDAYVLQKLAYVKDEAIGRRIVFESSPVSLNSGLHAYIPAQSLVMMETIVSMRTPGSRMATAKIEMVDKLLDVIVEKTINKVEREIPDMIQTMVSILRTLSKDEIMEIVMRLCATDVSGSESVIAKKRAIIMDVLPTLPHPEVPLILIRLIKERHISGVNAAALINIAVVTTTPSPAVINKLVEVVKDPEIVGQPVVQRSIILGIGVLSNKLVNLQVKMGIPQRTIAVLIKNVVKEMKGMLEIGDVETKVAVIKAVGNAGIVDFFPDVERILKDKSQPIIVREQAIYAMRRIAAVMPKAIRSVLLPVYMDPKEPQEVRVAAFLIIMETCPGFGTIQVIGHSLNAEPSVQVASFVYSYIQNIARTSAPELRHLRVIAKRVLMNVRPVIVSPVFNSKSIDAKIFTKYGGIGVEVDKINKVNRALPLAVVNKIYMFAFGRPIRVAEVGVEMEGIDQIIRKLFSVNGVVSDIWFGRKDISSILDPLAALDWGVVGEEIKKILAETDLPVREADVLKLAAYIKVFGHELNFVRMDKASIMDVIRSMQTSSYADWINTLVSGYNVDIVKAVPLVDNALILPTPVGLPLTLNISAIAAIAVKGQIKVDGITNIRDIISSPRKLSVVVNVRPSAAVNVYQSFGIQHDILELGTTVKRSVGADLPMSVVLDVDRTSEIVSLKIDVPKMIVPTVSVSNTPALFYRYVPMKIASYSASMYEIHTPKYVPIACEAMFKRFPVMVTYELPVVYMKAKMSGVVSYTHPSFYDPILLSMSPQELAVTIEPAYSTPDALVIELVYRKETVARESAPRGWFNWFTNDEAVAGVAAAGDQFVPVSISSAISNPITRQLYINLYTAGGYDEARLNSKLTITYDPSWLTYQINWQIVGSQVIMSTWKAKIDTIIHIPRLLRAVLKSPELSPTEVISSVDLSFGVDSFTENTVVVKMMPVYLSLNPAITTPVNYFRNISIKAVVYYGRVTSGVRSYWTNAVSTLQLGIIPYVSRLRVYPPTSETEHVEFIFEVFPQIRKVKIVVNAPSITYYIDDITIPAIWPLVQPIVPPSVKIDALPLLPEVTTVRRSPSDIASAIYGVCLVTPTNITTIADNVMPLPAIAPTCEIVMAHDASPQKLYTVTATPVTAAGARTIRIIVPNVKVEITNSLMASQPVVIVNGIARPVAVSEPVIITRSIDGKVREVIEVAIVGGKLVVRAIQVGLVVEIERVHITVKVSPMLMSTVAGMCSWVPRVPIMNPWVAAIGASPFSAVAPPVRSFVVKSEQCPANGVVPSVITSTCQVVERSMKITRVSEGVDQVCFSVRPMPACSGFCTPANSVSETVGFHCMPAGEVVGTPLEGAVVGDVSSQMANKVVHVYQAVLVPTQCIA